MGPYLRFLAAVSMLLALVTLYTNGIAVPAWLAALLLVGGIILLLWRGNLARKIIAVMGAIISLTMLSRQEGAANIIGLIGLLALIFLAAAAMFWPWFKGRY